MDNIQSKTSKKRKREEKDGELEDIISNLQNKPVSCSKAEYQKRTIEQDLTFWDNIRKEKLSDLLSNDKSFSFGNYNRYYYNRYLEALKDPRLELFQSDWFKNKTILDIGCNDGTLTILTAVTYQPIKIEGVDIDYKLVTKAVKNMKYVARNNLNRNMIESGNQFFFNEVNTNEESNNINGENLNLIDEILQNDSHEKRLRNKNLPVSSSSFERGKTNQRKNEMNQEIKKRLEDSLNTKSNLKDILCRLDSLPKSFLINLGLHQNEINKKEQLSTITNENNVNYPKNIQFRQENYISTLRDSDCKQYDTIMCMSIVKWIHLNYGDVGVKVLFHNVYSQLKDGGIFIFEPQNWRSYKKKRNLNARIKANFSKISFRPEQFQSYLEEIYNLKCINKLQPPSNSKKSFERPIFIFRKEPIK